MHAPSTTQRPPRQVAEAPTPDQEILWPVGTIKNTVARHSDVRDPQRELTSTGPPLACRRHERHVGHLGCQRAAVLVIQAEVNAVVHPTRHGSASHHRCHCSRCRHSSRQPTELVERPRRAGHRKAIASDGPVVLDGPRGLPAPLLHLPLVLVLGGGSLNGRRKQLPRTLAAGLLAQGHAGEGHAGLACRACSQGGRCALRVCC